MEKTEPNATEPNEARQKQSQRTGTRREKIHQDRKRTENDGRAVFLTVEAFYGVLAIRVAVRWFSPLLRASGAF